MAFRQCVSSSGAEFTGGEKMRGLDSQYTNFSQPSFPEWAYKDFTLYDDIAGDEDFELDSSETRAGLYPHQLVLEDASYREYEPPATYCSDACEHLNAPQGVVYDDPSTATRDSSLYSNAGSPQAMPAGSHGNSSDENSRSFRVYAATPFSGTYSTTVTLPSAVSHPTQLKEWNSTPQRHERIAYRFLRPHVPTTNTSHTGSASSRSTSSTRKHHHRSASKKRHSSKGA